MFICSQNCFAESQTCHVVYLKNDFFQGCKHVANRNTLFFGLWNVIF